MDSKTWNKSTLLISQQCLNREDFKHKATQIERELDEKNIKSQFLNCQELKSKRSDILNPKTEEDLKRTCFLYKDQNYIHQENNDFYNQIPSLYLTCLQGNGMNLFTYNIENETEEVKLLETPQIMDNASCITQLPNGDLFCFATSLWTGLTWVINSSYKIRELPSIPLCSLSSIAYFNRNVYCFWGYTNGIFGASERFNLDENRWIKICPINTNDIFCHSVIYKRNILISGYYNANIVLYSIDLDSFSNILYNFGWHKRKIMVSAEERLYLIECLNGKIYESEISNEYSWKSIGNSKIDIIPAQVY